MRNFKSGRTSKKKWPFISQVCPVGKILPEGTGHLYKQQNKYTEDIRTLNSENAQATRCPLSLADKPAECKSMQNKSLYDTKILITVTRSLLGK